MSTLIGSIIILAIGLIFVSRVQHKEKLRIKQLEEETRCKNKEIQRLRKIAEDEKIELETERAIKEKEEAELESTIESLAQKIPDYTSKNGKSFVDRRRYARLRLDVGIQYSVTGRDISPVDNGNSKNISEGGICITISEQVEEGDILTLTFNLPGDAQPIDAKGKVRWRKYVWTDDKKSRWNVGLEFTQINEEDRKRIAKFVSVTL